MKYAVLKVGGSQYIIREGEEFLVDFLNGKKPEPKVLLVVNDQKVTVGKPEVKKAKIKIKVLEDEVFGKKLHVQTFKAKSRYRRKLGFRPKYTKLLLEKINTTS